MEEINDISLIGQMSKVQPLKENKILLRRLQFWQKNSGKSNYISLYSNLISLPKVQPLKEK